MIEYIIIAILFVWAVLATWVAAVQYRNANLLIDHIDNYLWPMVHKLQLQQIEAFNLGVEASAQEIDDRDGNGEWTKEIIAIRALKK